MSTPDEQKQLDKIDAAVKGKGKKNRKSKRPGKTDLQAAGASDDGEEKAALSSSSLGRLTLTDAAGTDTADGGDDPSSDDSGESSSSSTSSSSSDSNGRRRRRKAKKKRKKKDKKHRYVEKDWKALKYYGRILAAGNRKTVLEVVENHEWRGPGVYHQQRRNAQAIDAMVEQLGLEQCSDILGFEILVRSTMGLFVADIEHEAKLTELYEWAPPQSFADPLSLRSKLKVVDRWNKAKERRDKQKKKAGAARGKGGAKE